MRAMRVVVLGGLMLKVLVLGAWWWDVAGPAYASKGEEPADPATASAKAEHAETPIAPELLAKSRGFRELLEAVQKRGAELDHREHAVVAREAALKTLEKTVADEVTRLEHLARPGGAEATAAAPAITKIYESMKAEEAAPILDRLDDATAKVILGRMKEKQIAAILAAMSRERAVQLTKVLSGHAQAPAAARPATP